MGINRAAGGRSKATGMSRAPHTRTTSPRGRSADDPWWGKTDEGRKHMSGLPIEAAERHAGSFHSPDTYGSCVQIAVSPRLWQGHRRAVLEADTKQLVPELTMYIDPAAGSLIMQVIAAAALAAASLSSRVRHKLKSVFQTLKSIALRNRGQ